MTDKTILLDIADGVATITLNRPDRLNSFTAAMHEELREAIAEVRDDKSMRCLLLTGAGRGFCAGRICPTVPSRPAPRVPTSACRSRPTTTR